MKSTVKYVQSLERKAFFTRNVRIPQRSPAPVIPRDERSTQGEDRNNTLTFLRLNETLEPKPFTLSELRHMREVDRSEIGFDFDRNTGTTQSQSSCVSSVDVPDSEGRYIREVALGCVVLGWVIVRAPTPLRRRSGCTWCVARANVVSACVACLSCGVTTLCLFVVGDNAASSRGLETKPTGVQDLAVKRATCLWCTSPREIVSGPWTCQARFRLLGGPQMTATSILAILLKHLHCGLRAAPANRGRLARNARAPDCESPVSHLMRVAPLTSPPKTLSA